MKRRRRIATILALILGTVQLAQAQKPQATPAPGSPSATTTISGKQLPPPAPDFGGVIKEKASESKPWWAPRVSAPEGRAQRVAHNDG